MIIVAHSASSISVSIVIIRCILWTIFFFDERVFSLAGVTYVESGMLQPDVWTHTNEFIE